MVVLAFIACIGARCHAVEIGPMPAVVCQMRGQAVMAEWLAGRSGSRVLGGWRCVAPGRSA